MCFFIASFHGNCYTKPYGMQRRRMGKVKNDQFADIAASFSGGRSHLLYEPAPKKGSDRTLRLVSGGKPRAVKEKMCTAEELREALSDEREKYVPYLRSLAPFMPSYEKNTHLERFSYRLEEETHSSEFLSLLMGEGDWEEVTLPHYGGPVGNRTAYYRTAFSVEKSDDERVILAFGGVDYLASVFVNGHLAGTHEGFFSPFEVDATPFVKTGENILLVRVENDFIYMGNKTEAGEKFEGDKLYAATGLGYDDAAFGWHHCPPGMGIYGPVTVSVRKSVFLSDLFVRPLPEEHSAELWIEVDSGDIHAMPVSFEIGLVGENFSMQSRQFSFTPSTGRTVGMGDSLTEAAARKNGELGKEIPLFCKKGKNEFRFILPMEEFRWWDLESPYLYAVQVTLMIDGKAKSTRSQTFGMRSFSQDTESQMKGMFYLNGRPIRLRGANTMGFEQQDVLRGDTEQLIRDILLAKICHMNFLRLTQRPVQKEVYDMCDRLGLMTQTDLPLFGCMRRTKFSEGVRQAEEMAKIVRSHPANVLVSYINEPFPNANNEPHRHLNRTELEDFFVSCDKAVHLHDPDRVIKPVDGDYDPPSYGMPDNHCYPLWYNGHGIDIGKLHKGYWLPVAPNWYYGCGEFGIEGLDPVNVMQEDYPKEWMQPDTDGTWNPGRIIGAQTAAFHYMFYDTQTTPETWGQESQAHQARGLRLMTEAFRRNPDMVSFAVHLFIDAWPSGWMKTIMDHRRQPKRAYFAYRDALRPVLLSLRTDRFAYFGDEEVRVESFLCNDTPSAVNCPIRYELLSSEGMIAFGESVGVCPASDAKMIECVEFTLPTVNERREMTVRAHFGEDYTDLPLTVFPYEEIKTSADVSVEQDVSEAVKKAREGYTVLLEKLEPGKYNIGEHTVFVKEAGMLPLHFVSRNTGHALVKGFHSQDFSLWYDANVDRITPLLDTTFTGEGIIPVLTSGNMNGAGEWGSALACGELSVGKGKIILCQVDLRKENPVARIFYNRIMESETNV